MWRVRKNSRRDMSAKTLPTSLMKGSSSRRVTVKMFTERRAAVIIKLAALTRRPARKSLPATTVLFLSLESILAE